MKLIDSHCHLNHPDLAEQLGQVTHQANGAGVHGFIIPGVVAAQWPDILNLGTQDKGFHAAAGLHPLFLADHKDHDLVVLEELCSQKRLVAVGEIGLDFYNGKERQIEQQQLFEQQLAIADTFGLPLILHVRKAHDQVLSILRRKKFTRGGSVHAFNGSLQQAQQYIEMGFVIGVGGSITYSRAKKIRTMVQGLPVESIILETDSPDMLVSGKEHGPNLPQYLPEVLKSVAQLKQFSSEKLAEMTWNTTHEVFRIN